MIIEKTEAAAVAYHQIRWLGELGQVHIRENQSLSGDRVTYRYKFVPGQAAVYVGPVLRFLQDKVWTLPPLTQVQDRSDLEYLAYIEGLVLQLDLDLDVDLLSVGGAGKHLVHGDACLENFIMTENGIVAIDPGLPRGFNNRYNDLGKICQSVLTHWQFIKYGCVLLVPPGAMMSMEINYQVISSLLTHWVRILKNENRHVARVGRYGRKAVVPILQQALRDNKSTRASRSRWDFGVLAGIHDQLLRASLEYVREEDAVLEL